MIITEGLLRDYALELDALLEAFENTYLHFVDRWDEEQTTAEVEERDRACVAFYRIRDMVINLAMKSTELADTLGGFRKAQSPKTEAKAASPKRGSRRTLQAAGGDTPPSAPRPAYRKRTEGKPKAAEPPADNPYTPPGNVTSVPTDFTAKGVADVVSTLGRVRIINTENGPMYAAVDIADVCGSRAPKKWVERNCQKVNRYDFTLKLMKFPQISKDGRHLASSINFITKDDAEKIMALLSCPADIEEWIRSKVFTHDFKGVVSEFANIKATKRMRTVKEYDTGQERRTGRNTAIFGNGQLQVSWE